MKESAQDRRDVGAATADAADVELAIVLVEDRILARVPVNILEVRGLAAIRNAGRRDVTQERIPAKHSSNVGSVDADDMADVLECEWLDDARYSVRQRMFGRPVGTGLSPIVVIDDRVDVIDDVWNP